MVELYEGGVYLINGRQIVPDDGGNMEKPRALWGGNPDALSRESAREGTIAFSILSAHNRGDSKNLQIRFDSLTSHDITYVGIIQTARAGGMKRFPVPYVMTNCHNSLCAVGGTVNEDDHMFALSAAKKYGGIYVPPHLAVIHSYNREKMAGCGKMILGSDSHTRYGALGTMGVGEGGGELAKQMVGRTCDLPWPGVTGVFLTGKPRKGVGPHDVALFIIKAVFDNGFVKNRVMEFVGDGVSNLSVDFRNGVDVMTTETACWSSVWRTDGAVREWLKARGREEDYRELNPGEITYYDGMIRVNLSEIEPGIAMPFHPSNVYSIREFRENAADILDGIEEAAVKALGISGLGLKSRTRNGEFFVDQAVVAGCAGGTFENLTAAADILEGASIGNGAFSMSMYPESQPTYAELIKNGSVAKLMSAGVIMRSAFCGPCFGAGDTPANGGFSIRHTTRNFPSREGAKPGEGQFACVALMDARSIAATAANGGRLTAADETDFRVSAPLFFFDRSIYEKRVYDGTGKPDPNAPLVMGPGIRDWPEIAPLADDLLIRVVSCITDPVTTTDELIPSGETSSFRSDPLRLAQFTLSRRDPGYVKKAEAVRQTEEARKKGISPTRDAEFERVYKKIAAIPGHDGVDPLRVGIGSAVYARRPGDGSAREQAASCQRVLGASAGLALEYATKRYRSNLINWGVIPFLVNAEDESRFGQGTHIFLPGIRRAILEKSDSIQAWLIGESLEATAIPLAVGELTDAERRILADGCLINYYRNSQADGEIVVRAPVR